MSWDILEQYMEEEKEIEVKVSEVVKGGVIAYVDGIRGFIPASHLSLNYVENLEEWVNKRLTVKVITVDGETKKLVMSAKAVEKQRVDEENHKISALAAGTIMEGVVESLMPYGAFIALPDGLSGLVHISRISQKRINKPSEALNVGDKVKVKVLNTNDGKISLSMKDIEENSRMEEVEKVETAKYNSNEQIGTSLGDLFKKLNL